MSIKPSGIPLADNFPDFREISGSWLYNGTSGEISTTSAGALIVCTLAPSDAAESLAAFQSLAYVTFAGSSSTALPLLRLGCARDGTGGIELQQVSHGTADGVNPFTQSRAQVDGQCVDLDLLDFSPLTLAIDDTSFRLASAASFPAGGAARRMLFYTHHPFEFLRALPANWRFAIGTAAGHTGTLKAICNSLSAAPSGATTCFPGRSLGFVRSTCLWGTQYFNWLLTVGGIANADCDYGDQINGTYLALPHPYNDLYLPRIARTWQCFKPFTGDCEGLTAIFQVKHLPSGTYTNRVEVEVGLVGGTLIAKWVFEETFAEPIDCLATLATLPQISFTHGYSFGSAATLTLDTVDATPTC
jgi:hypothetical protein